MTASRRRLQSPQEADGFGSLFLSQQGAMAAVSVDAEQLELDELHKLLFSGQRSARGSTVPVGLFVKYEVSIENRNKAEQARKEREHRDQIRMEKAKAQYQETQDRRNKVRGKNAGAMRELNERNLEQGQQIRAHKQAWEEIRQRDRQKFLEENKLKCEKGRANDARLDALEEATDEAERREATAARQNRMVAAQTFKVNLIQAKKDRVAIVREGQRAFSSRLAEVGQANAEAVKECRLAYLKGEEQKKRDEAQRLRKVAQSRARIVESHAACARAKEEMLLKKQIEVQQIDRMAEITIAAAKSDLLRQNQMKRQEQFASRYVTQTAAASFDSSTFRHYYMMDKDAEKAIAQANARLFHSVKTMKSRTDDFIGDDEAGLARAKAREASEARRKALALKIAKQNQELQERLALVKAVTDTDVTDDDGGAVQAASEKAAADSKARRKAEAEKIAKHAADMKAKIKNTAARTDDDLTDEAVFDAGKQMAADLESKKGAKAEALSKANAAQKERLSKVAAVTDDDISDEKAWEARTKLGDESEERREAEAKKLAEENAEYRALIEGATAKVDDDITDEPAGMARKVA